MRQKPRKYLYLETPCILLPLYQPYSRFWCKRFILVTKCLLGPFCPLYVLISIASRRKSSLRWWRFFMYWIVLAGVGDDDRLRDHYSIETPDFGWRNMWTAPNLFHPSQHQFKDSVYFFLKVASPTTFSWSIVFSMILAAWLILIKSLMQHHSDLHRWHSSPPGQW